MSVQPIRDMVLTEPSKFKTIPSVENKPVEVSSGREDILESIQSEQDIKQEVDAAVENLKSILNRDVKMSVDKDLNKVVVRIVDGKTGEVIREIPQQEIVNISKKLDRIQGILFDKEA